MIKYIDWGNHLRWGNFGLLYMGLLSISKQSNNNLVLPPYFAWNYLESPPEIDSSGYYDEIFHFRQTNYTPEEKSYIVNYFSENREKIINVNLGSHLQSELWFSEDLEYVKSKMKIKESEIQKVKNKYSKVFEKKVIGIGIRRGDFVNHGCFYQIPLDWYLKALKAEFPDWENYNILFFSDHIEEIKKYFKGNNFFFAEPNGTHTHADNFKHYHKNPFEQFILGTLCNGFVIGSSTFSWLQAWYVSNNGYKIVHSNKNLAGECLQKFYNPDYYPKNWIIHPV